MGRGSHDHFGTDDEVAGLVDETGDLKG